MLQSLCCVSLTACSLLGATVSAAAEKKESGASSSNPKCPECIGSNGCKQRTPALAVHREVDPKATTALEPSVDFASGVQLVPAAIRAAANVRHAAPRRLVSHALHR